MLAIATTADRSGRGTGSPTRTPACPRASLRPPPRAARFQARPETRARVRTMSATVITGKSDRTARPSPDRSTTVPRPTAAAEQIGRDDEVPGRCSKALPVGPIIPSHHPSPLPVDPSRSSAPNTVRGCFFAAAAAERSRPRARHRSGHGRRGSRCRAEARASRTSHRRPEPNGAPVPESSRAPGPAGRDTASRPCPRSRPCASRLPLRARSARFPCGHRRVLS